MEMYQLDCLQAEVGYEATAQSGSGIARIAQLCHK